MSKLLGAKELHGALQELGDMDLPEWKSAMRSAVRVPMNKVRKRALGNIAKISPGNTPLHRTYRGRLVARGFASRSLKVIVRLFSKQGQGSTARAVLGVAAEAFYAVAFFEKGTSRIPRQPWLVPALEAMKNTAVTDVGAALKKRIDKIAAKWNSRSKGATK